MARRAAPTCEPGHSRLINLPPRSAAAVVTQAVGACRSRSASGVRIVAAGAGSRRQCVPTSSAAASAPPGLSSGRRDAGEAAAESASQRLGGQDAFIQRVWLALRLPQAWDRIEYQPGGQGQKWSEAFAPRSQVEAMVAELEAKLGPIEVAAVPLHSRPAR